MNEQEKQAMLHHEAMQKQAAATKNSGGISGAVDDVRHKVLEEPYFLRPEGRTVTDDIQPKRSDLYGAQTDVTPNAEQKQAAADDFFDTDRTQEAEQSQALNSEREIGL